MAFMAALEADLRALSAEARRRHPAVKDAAEHAILKVRHSRLTPSSPVIMTPPPISCSCRALGRSGSIWRREWYPFVWMGNWILKCSFGFGNSSSNFALR